MRILLAGHFGLNQSTASALRVRGMLEALLLGGHTVTVVDNGDNGASPPRIVEVAIQSGLIQLLTVDEYSAGLFSSLPRGLRGLFIGDVSAETIRTSGLQADCIIVYGTHLGYLTRYRHLARELGARLVLDVVEWYQAGDLPGGPLGPYSIANEISMRAASKSVDGVITLSTRLEAHYRRADLPVVSIPPLFWPMASPAQKWSKSDGRLHLCYAGSPGRKEAMDLVLMGVEHAQSQGADLRLHMVGTSLDDLGRISRRAQKIVLGTGDLVQLYGRVPNHRARDIVAASDFTILLRRKRKANQFGFPSKLAESFSLGTPLIANDFSDVTKFLASRENGLVLPRLGELGFAQALCEAADMPAEMRQAMAVRALETARQRFSPHAVVDRLSAFLESLSPT